MFPVLLILIAMLAPLAMTSFVPALPAIAAKFGVSVSTVQWVLSVSLLASAFASLAYGEIADRFGRRPALLIGFLIAVLGGVLAAFSSSIEWVIVGRALQAVGAGAAYVLVRVLVHDVYTDSRGIKVLGYVTAAMAIAPMIGPIAGGVLIDTLGWRWIFGATSIAALLLTLICAAILPETRAAEPIRNTAQQTPKWHHLLKRASFLRFMIVGTMVFVTFYAFVAGAPFLMIQGLGMSATTYGLYYLIAPIGFLLGSLITGKIGHYAGYHKLCLFGMLGSLISSLAALLWLSLSPTQPWALFLPMFGVTLSAGICLPAAQAGLVEAASEQPGVGSGLFTFLQLTFSAVTAQLVGYGLAIGLGHATVTVALVLASATGLIGYAFWTRQARQEEMLAGAL